MPKKPKPAAEKGREALQLDGGWVSVPGPVSIPDITVWTARPPQSAQPVTGWPPPAQPSWYWREFTVPDRWAKMNVRLHLGGLQVEDVWVNGKRVPRPETDSEPGAFDITKALKRGQPNFVAFQGAGLVRRVARRPWQPEFRGAELIAADEAHLSHLSVDGKPNGWLTVHVEFFDASEKNGNADLVVDIAEQERPRRVLATATQHVAVSPGLNRSDITLRLKGAMAWSTDRPVVYVASVRFTQLRDLLDNAVVPFVFSDQGGAH